MVNIDGNQVVSNALTRWINSAKQLISSPVRAATPHEPPDGVISSVRSYCSIQ